MRLADDVAELGTIEQRPSLDGRNMTMLLSPTRTAETGETGEHDAIAQEGGSRRKREARARREQKQAGAPAPDEQPPADEQPSAGAAEAG
jgi:translation initiation factor IF-3